MTRYVSNRSLRASSSAAANTGVFVGAVVILRNGIVVVVTKASVVLNKICMQDRKVVISLNYLPTTTSGR